MVFPACSLAWNGILDLRTITTNNERRNCRRFAALRLRDDRRSQRASEVSHCDQRPQHLRSSPPLLPQKWFDQKKQLLNVTFESCSIRQQFQFKSKHLFKPCKSEQSAAIGAVAAVNSMMMSPIATCAPLDDKDCQLMTKIANCARPDDKR